MSLNYENITPSRSSKKYAWTGGFHRGSAEHLAYRRARRAEREEAVDKVINVLSVGCAGILGWVILPCTLLWSFTVLFAPAAPATAQLVSTGETITEQLGTSNQLSLWVLLGVPFLLVSLALVLNFGLGPYSLYFMRETAVATRIKTLLLGLPFTLAVGSLIAWLMADGAALGV